MLEKYTPVELRNYFKREVPGIVTSHLDWWSAHIHKSKDLKLMHEYSGAAWIPSVLLQGKLTSFSQHEQTQYDNLSQFLQYVKTGRLQSYTNGCQLLALKSLQIEEFLKSNEPPMHRYVYTKGDKNRKTKTETNPKSGAALFLQ